VSPRRRSAWRHSRLSQITLGAAAAVVAVAAVVAGLALVDQHSTINQAAFADCASAAPVQSAGSAQPAGTAGADPSASASAAPCPAQSGGSASPSASAAGPRVNVAANDFASGPIARQQLGGVATAPVDGQGEAISLNQSSDEAADSGNCTIRVPSNPLTAQGLATPYQLGDGCAMANGDEQAFVEATILAPNGKVQIYDPLVITAGTRPAAKTVTPKIAKGSEVIIDFGFNGTNLVLVGPGSRQRSSGCVDALGQSVIGQVSACNAVPFYNLANSEIARGKLKVPAGGTSTDGQACQTSRDFALIDQDQSDNTYSQYLLSANGQTAQATAAIKARLTNASTITNGSDNALLGDFVDPANGCQPFSASDPTNPAGTQSSQALDELSAAADQRTNIAVIPTNDEMVLVGGAYSIAKTNMYRSLVDQPQLAANTNPYEVAAAYCLNMVNIAPARNLLDMSADTPVNSPVPDVGDNLATFLGNRLSMSFDNLGCDAFGLSDPVNVTADGDGVATSVSYDTAQQQATLPASEASTTASGGKHHGPTQGHDHWHKVQDPSGM
jgi:hypothetical protein